jgi:hypothetical protein
LKIADIAVEFGGSRPKVAATPKQQVLDELAEESRTYDQFLAKLRNPENNDNPFADLEQDLTDGE